MSVLFSVPYALCSTRISTFLWHRHSCLCSLNFWWTADTPPANPFLFPEEHLSSKGSLAALGIKSLCCYLLYLPKLQLYWCRAAKDRHHHFQGLAVFVHFVHRAVEIRKRPIGDAHSFVLFKLHTNLGLVLAYVHAIDDVVDLLFGQWRRIVGRPHKTRNAGRRLHHMPHMVAFAAGAKARQIHLHQHVAEIKHPLHGIFFAVADLRHRLRRNHDLADLFSQAKSLYA